MRVGDRVRVVSGDYEVGVGTEGVVRYTSPNHRWGDTSMLLIGVDFGDGFDGHTLDGDLETRTGFYQPEDALEVI